MITQVTIFTVTLLVSACAANYGGGYSGIGGETVEGGYGGGANGGYGRGQKYPPKPYHFHYFVDDRQGNSHYRNEQIDKSGAVRGIYGYRDAQGLDRVVEYVADARVFRANITTNEPGTDGKENPADINIVVIKPPAVIQHRYTKVEGTGGYGSGIEGVSRPQDFPIDDIFDGLQKSKCETGENFNVRDCLKDIGRG